MGIFSFPRIYFKGYMCWDPATANNNDYYPTYSDLNSALNWDFLKNAKSGITDKNFKEKFRPWAIENQVIDPYTGGDCQAPSGIPAEWNYFGGNAAHFVDYEDKKSFISGGALGVGEAVEADPLIGKPVVMQGNPFGDPDHFSPGRLVDGNPISVYTSQIYYKSLTFGDADTGIVGQRAYRMQSRFINFTRNVKLGAAGGASVSWQACFPKSEGLQINNAADSPLLAALTEALQDDGALGVMVQFNTYLNLYFQNGCFNDFTPTPTENDHLPPLYRQVLKGDIDPFSNPCYSRVVGVIGVWSKNELSTVPNGRYLVPVPSVLLSTSEAEAQAQPPAALQMSFAAVHAADPGDCQNGIRVPSSDRTQPKPAVQLGVTLVEVDYDKHILSLDLLNTFPEYFWQGDKVDFGTINVGVRDESGVFTLVATLPYQAGYDQVTYENNGGLVDLPFEASLADTIRNGTLAFQVPPETRTVKQEKGSNGPCPPPKYSEIDDKVVMIEEQLTAQADRRSTYLNQNCSDEIVVGVRSKGQPVAGAKVLVAKYNPPDALFRPTNIIASDDPQVVTFTTGTTKTITLEDQTKTVVTIVDADAEGMATVGVSAANPGLPVLAFYPFLEGQAEPKIPTAYDGSIVTGFFASVRVMSFDDHLVDEFVKLWNDNYRKTDAPQIAWKFIYNEILYVYDMLFPIMDKYMPLGNLPRVEGAVDQILTLISAEYEEESTLAMPITRDLSAGKRKVLELWGSLVKRRYPPEPISASG